MKQLNLKIFTILVIFFLIDLIRPLNYSLQTEFLFIGILFLCIFFPLSVAVPQVLFFGYAKDVLSIHEIPLNLIEFFVLALLIRQIVAKFNPIAARILVLVCAAGAHILFRAVLFGHQPLRFYAFFFMHTALLYLCTEYWLKRWIHAYSVKSSSPVS
ncbi:MAG: hypothetical protein GF333_02845 [Candidatus Omnitrophica bacterium]|nr:hypothetical protein [Candidatus Omnitrophota bacterium]